LLWECGAEYLSVFCCFFSVQSITYSDIGQVFESSAKCRFICEEEREFQVIHVFKLGKVNHKM